ncbi:MAG: TonB-dependent receptor [Bacteroidales bacterium]|nr:TonB-dependent receptor [Bacteroidales bacterium]
MKSIRIIVVTIFIFIFHFSFFNSAVAQQGTVRGRVVDARTGENIEYATVALLNPKDSTLKGGTVTESNGSFRIEAPYGRYLLRITFVGYEPQYYKSSVTLSAEHSSVNLGKVAINPQATLMEAVEVVAERSMVEYQLDKRVVNVDKNIVAGGGTASDVLEQVPSVAIDNDGNVTLRGSSNVKVLVNGRPSELLASDLATLLEQIPASTVENVEVITNPSAKYDPEGMSGIINIKLKDRTAGALGLNGVVNVNVGAPLPFMVPDSLPSFIPTAMGNISLNYTTEKYNLFFNADAGLRQRGNKSESDIEYLTGGAPVSHNTIEQYGLNPNRMGSVKVGGEYYFNDKNSLLLSYQLRGGNRQRNSNSYATDLLYHDSLDYLQTATSDNNNINHSFNLLYTRKFDRKDEELTFDATFSTREVHGEGLQEQTYADALANYDHYYRRRSITENHHQALNLKLNWLRPLDSFFGKEGWRLETGYEGRMDWPDQCADYYRTIYNNTGGSYTYYGYYDSLSSTHFNYRQQVHAIYATLGGNLTDALSLQAGLRGEYASIYGRDLYHPQTAAIDKPYWQLYPTVHMSYKITDLQSAQVSYSRRVHRPHFWDLNPFIDIREDNQMSFGNPNLDPEYTNAFELSYNLGIKKVNLFTSLYYRQTNNMITHYGFTWCADSVARYAWWEPYNPEYDGYRASTRLNLSTGYNYGMEFIFDWQIFQWWKININVNLYKSHIEGTELLHNQSTSSFQASGKFSSFMMLPDDWTIQLSGQYWAPWLDLQTKMDPGYWVDLAVKKDVFQKRGTINLRVSDVFCTGGWGHTTYSQTFNRVVKAKRLSPVVTLGFSWKINNGLKQRPQQQEEEGGDESTIY